MKKKTSNLITIILILILLAGLSLLLYPTVSDYWNSFHQSRAIASYAEQVAEIDSDTYEQLLADAQAYNRSLIGKVGRYDMTDEEKAEHPTHETTGGYLKVLDESECSQIWWEGLSEYHRDIIRSLPNFDATIFEQCTGIKVGKEESEDDGNE